MSYEDQTQYLYLAINMFIAGIEHFKEVWELTCF